LPGFDLRELGWNDELAENLEPGLVPGRVAAVHRGAFDVWTERGAVRTRLPGRLMHEGLDVGAGDWVGLGDGLVRAVLPRRSAIVRNAAGLTTTPQTLAANVDVAFADEYRHRDRFEAFAQPHGLTESQEPVPVTLAELVAEVEAVALGVPVHVVSAVTGEGCGALRARIGAGETAVLLGSSGVGKSTLVNLWLGEEAMATRETREDDDEGRHTTTHRQLLILPGGGLVIDTPGLRELQLWDAGSAALDATFADVEGLAADCRFGDCTHVHEPECAVLAAVESGELPGERLHSWRKLQRELRAIALRQDARLRKEETRKWKLRAREGRARARHR
jgi:ribosome biogenesis GTPase